MQKNIAIYIVGVILVLLCAIFCLSVGRYEIPISNILNIFSRDSNEVERNILFSFRLPRIVLAIVVGAGLSAAGAAFQSLFRNPLASPDILGVTSGASFGAVLALLLGFRALGVGIFGFIFGILALLLVVAVSYRRNLPYDTITMILSGVIISALFSSLVSLVKYLADPQDTLPAITYWLLGSLEHTLNLQNAANIFGIICGIFVIFMLRWKLNILALNDDEARTLGVNLTRLRILVILASTIIVSCSVSLCGIIGWVGLLVPHLARLCVGSNNIHVVPLSIIIGALFLMIVDTLARSISANQIPISILTAIVGAPFFIYILHKIKG